AILAAIALPAYRDYTSKAKIASATASVAGEKIKVGENFGAGKTGAALCEGAVNCTEAGGVVTLTGTNAGSAGATTTADTTVTLVTPALTNASTQITWDCTVTVTPTAKYANKKCDNLG